MGDRNTAIRRNQLKPIRSDDLDATNSPSLGQVPSLGVDGQFIWTDLAGGGDMLKSIYDTDGDGIVDKAEIVDDGSTGGIHASTAEEVRDAVDKKHSPNTDTLLPISLAPTTQTGQGIKASATYGESITLGDLLYFKSDGKVYKADATSIATAKIPCLFLALATASSGSHDILIKGTYKDSTKWTGGTVLTVGGEAGICYLDTTAGALTQTPPSAIDNIIQRVGEAIATDTIYFCPSIDYMTHA